MSVQGRKICAKIVFFSHLSDILKQIMLISPFFEPNSSRVHLIFLDFSNRLIFSALYFCSFELVTKRVGNNFNRVGTGTKTRPEW